ncbi:unnamed protein product, partial [Brenthis ino]
MNSLQSSRLSEDDLLSSPSSDEKMDTASESLRSTQNTPNSILSDSDERETEVLRLQNPNVLRLSEPEKLDNKILIKTDLSDSVIIKMSNLMIDSSKKRPKNLGISPPRHSSALTLTTNHPLMGLGSPDENFPDALPKKVTKNEEEKDLSVSSIEDERTTTNGYELYTPLRNTSKNNLYYSDNFVTADSQVLNDSLNFTPDVARMEQKERRKIIPRFIGTPVADNATQKDCFDDNIAIKKYADNKLFIQSTPKALAIDIPEPEEFHTVAEWCESPSHLRAMPNFDLPIEMSSSIGMHNDLESPDVISSSTQEDRSAYQAMLDPYTGSVALRHTAPRSNPPRRKVQLPPEEDDRCSLDSVSGCSMESEDEPPPPPPQHVQDTSEEDNTKRSKSTNTVSECSDPIPEYSAAEEFRDERSWLTVQHGGGCAVCDMKVIEPFKRVVSHGGYERGGAALIVFSACYLPDNARADYRYVMDNLFLYVTWSLERLVTDEYVLVYLHGSAGRRRMPSFTWLHECYKLLDRRLRKSLKHLYLVHPTFWLKSFVLVAKAFVSSKFLRKLTYVKSLKELLEKVPVEPNAIPEIVKQYDEHRQ